MDRALRVLGLAVAALGVVLLLPGTLIYALGAKIHPEGYTWSEDE